MIWPGCGSEAAAGAELVGAGQGLGVREGADGSFSLWSEAFGEGFHSGRGALREARETFLAPSQLERFGSGERLRVVEVAVGTGSNLALLLEACAARGLLLEWRGLELDPEPLAVALAAAAFRRPWQPDTLRVLEQVWEQGSWRSERSSGRMLWGDARQTLAELGREWRGQVDLVWHDAFSPRRCPQLWTVEVLGAATALLAPEGRWISYCSAAAVRETLRQLGLNLAALEIQAAPAPPRNAWSGGTLASPAPLGSAPLGFAPLGFAPLGSAPLGSAPLGPAPLGSAPLGPSRLWRELSALERDHLASAAGEPYRDPSGRATAAAIFARRLEAQAAALASGARTSSSAWRRRWGVLGVGG